MKTLKISLIVFLIFGVTYFILDKQLFYYGKNDFNIYNPLPLKIKPEFRYDFEGGFVLWDEHEMSLAGKGVRYWNFDIEVDEIIGYGYTDEKLIAQIVDTIGSNYYIEFSLNENPQSKQDITVNVWSEAEKPTLDDYKWIEIIGNEKQIRTLDLLRNYLLVVLFLLIVIMVIKIVRSKRGKINTPAERHLQCRSEHH